MKNLDILIPHSTEFTPKYAKWNSAWRCNGQKVTKRIRSKNALTGKQSWKILRKTIANPSAVREVWLVVGNGLQKNELIEKIMKVIKF